MSFENTNSTLREVLLEGDFDVQKGRLTCYYYGLTDPEKLGPFTGAHFDAFEPQTRELNEFTAADLYAVSALSVNVPPRAGFSILAKDGAPPFNACLRAITPDQKIEDITTQEEFDYLLGPSSPAGKLWDLLRRNNPDHNRWDIGPTVASKMMHRKRPHLIPIYDSVTNNALGTGAKNHWQAWWEALAGDDGADLREHANNLRKAIDKEELSLLRVLDVVVWMDPDFNTRAKPWDEAIKKHVLLNA